MYMLNRGGSLLEGEKMVERVLGMDMGEVRIGAGDSKPCTVFLLLPYQTVS